MTDTPDTAMCLVPVRMCGWEFIVGNDLVVPISDVEALDIDTEFDMKIARIIAENSE